MPIDTSSLIGPQPEHTQRLVDSLLINGFAFDASETGTGKTYCAAAAVRALNRPVAVVCPKAVMPAWTKVLTMFGIKPKMLINYEKLGRGNTQWMKWKKLADPMKPWKENEFREMPEFRIPKDCVVILDEGHKCKGADTTNAWMMIALALQKYDVLVSSATAACSPLEMRAFGYLTKLHNLHNFTDFCRVHGAGWLGKFGAMVWDGNSNEARTAMLALNEFLFRTIRCASRMTREQFGDLFPESHVVAEAYDLGSTDTAKIQKVYETMEYELAKLEEHTENYSEHIFAILTKARRHAELCKVPIFTEMAEDLFDEGKSVVIFVNFSQTGVAIAKRLNKMKKLKGLIGYIVGGQSAKERETEIAAFQADEKRVMIVNIAAGGVGVSLHDLRGKFPRASVVSPTWSAINMLQSLGRVWRAGGMSTSYQRIVYAAGCIEEQICRKVQDKLSCLETLNDGELMEAVIWVS